MNETITVEIVKDCSTCKLKLTTLTDPAGDKVVLCNVDGQEHYDRDCCEHWEWVHSPNPRCPTLAQIFSGD